MWVSEHAEMGVKSVKGYSTDQRLWVNGVLLKNRACTIHFYWINGKTNNFDNYIVNTLNVF